MILKKIYVSLVNLGFNIIGINRNNISLFQRTIESTIDVVAIYDSPLGTEYSSKQITHINKQIKNYFFQKGYFNVNLLGIICTNNAGMAKKIALNNDNIWIIDTHEKGLIIFENQDNNFSNLEKQIQCILRESRTNNWNTNDTSPGTYEPSYPKTKPNKNFLSQFMSELNTIIIILNILVYTIVNIIIMESGKEYLMLSGALYWPSIVYDNEYYRLFTYMFLHANTSHLFNNMLILFFLGDNLERAAGKWKYLIIYFASGIFAGIASMAYNMAYEYKDRKSVV